MYTAHLLAHTTLEPAAVAAGSVAIAGQGVSWLRDAVGFISDPVESELVASSVQDTAGVYFVPAFGGLLAPWWRDDARGVILGLTQYTTKVGSFEGAGLDAGCAVAVYDPRAASRACAGPDVNQI